MWHPQRPDTLVCPASGEDGLAYEADDERIGGFTIQEDGTLLLF